MRQLVSSNGKFVIWWDIAGACLRLSTDSQVSKNSLKRAATIVCLGVYPTALRKILLNASGTHVLLLEDTRVHIAELPAQCCVGEDELDSVDDNGTNADRSEQRNVGAGRTEQDEKAAQVHTAQCSVLYETSAKKSAARSGRRLLISDVKWMPHSSFVGILVSEEQFILYDAEIHQQVAEFSVIETLLNGATQARPDDVAQRSSPQRSELARSICEVLGNRVSDFDFVSNAHLEPNNKSGSDGDGDSDELRGHSTVVEPFDHSEVSVLFSLDGGEFYTINFSIDAPAENEPYGRPGHTTETTVNQLSFVNKSAVGSRNENLFDDFIDLDRIALLPTTSDAVTAQDESESSVEAYEPRILVAITRQRASYHFLVTGATGLCLIETVQFDQSSASESEGEKDSGSQCMLLVDHVMPGRYYVVLPDAVYAVRVALRDAILHSQCDTPLREADWSKPSDVERVVSTTRDALACGACVMREAPSTTAECVSSNYFRVTLVTMARSGCVTSTQLGFADLLLDPSSRESSSGLQVEGATQQSQREAIDFVRFVEQYLHGDAARANRVGRLLTDWQNDAAVLGTDVRKLADTLRGVALANRRRIDEHAVLFNAVQQRRMMLLRVAAQQRAQLNTNQTRCAELCDKLVRIFDKQARVTVRLREAHLRIDRLVDVLRRRFDVAWRRDSARVLSAENELRVRAIDAQRRAARLATATSRVADKLDALRQLAIEDENENDSIVRDSGPESVASGSTERCTKTKLSAELNKNNAEIQGLIARVSELSTVVKQLEGRR